MPLRLKDIQHYGSPISFLDKGQVEVRIGPCSARSYTDEKITLDGRHYICAGTIFLKNGMQLRANFEINTHTFNFLEHGSVKVYIENEEAWYYIEEDELYATMGLKKEDALPYTWQPDKPLNYHDSGPYPMKVY